MANSMIDLFFEADVASKNKVELETKEKIIAKASCVNFIAPDKSITPGLTVQMLANDNGQRRLVVLPAEISLNLLPSIRIVRTCSLVKFWDDFLRKQVFSLKFNSAPQALKFVRQCKSYIGSRLGNALIESRAFYRRHTWIDPAFIQPYAFGRSLTDRFLEKKLPDVEKLLKFDLIKAKIEQHFFEENDDLPEAVEAYSTMNDADILLALRHYKSGSLRVNNSSVLFERPFNWPHLYCRGKIDNYWRFLATTKLSLGTVEALTRQLFDFRHKMLEKKANEIKDAPRCYGDVEPDWCFIVERVEIFKAGVDGVKTLKLIRQVRPCLIMMPRYLTALPLISVFTTQMIAFSPDTRWHPTEVLAIFTEAEPGYEKTRWLRLIDLGTNFAPETKTVHWALFMRE